MNLLPRSKIQIRPDRQRKEFNDTALISLANSIASVGLINPIVVTSEPDGIFLVAGERRLRAIDQLSNTAQTYRHASAQVPATQVPVIYFNDLSELEREELELEENIAREDLSWLERANAIARLDALRKKQSPAHTTADTAKEIFGTDAPTSAAIPTVNRALALAKAAASDPEIAGAKNENDAYKLLTRKEERKRFEQLALDDSQGPQNDRHRIIHADCLTWMAAQPAGQFDIILTDPPYGMAAQAFGDAGGKLTGIEHHYEDSQDATRELIQKWMPEAYRIAAPNSFLFLWCDIDQFTWLRDLALISGWRPFRTPFINVKREGGRVPWPTQGPRRCYELCLYAVKGDRKTRSIVKDAFESTLHEGNFGHGAQKPVEAYEYLLRMVAEPGDVVLDTFAGTGTLLRAAENVKLRSVCVEQDLAHFGIMKDRLEKLSNGQAEFFNP